MTYFSPSALCVSDEAGEHLTEAGREFAALVYHLTSEAHQAAWGAVRESDYKSESRKKADKVLDGLSACLLFARALTVRSRRTEVYRAPGATNGRERGAFLPALNSLGDGRGHTTHVTTADRNGMFVALT